MKLHRIAALALATAAAPLAAKNNPVMAAAEAARAEQLKLLETLVNIDSGTGDVAGGTKVQAIVAERLRGLGLTVRTVPAEAPGLPDNLVATISGKGKGRILMIGHIDTVFEPGTAAQRPFHIDGDRATGPGVGDEKGGVVEGITALTLLKQLNFHDYKSITFLVETSEERGSPGTRKLIDELVREADVELNLEPGQPGGAITVWRKGSTSFTISVKGRPAHAGVDPQNGRNAAYELIHQLQLADSLPKTGDGVTANLTILKAGSRYNIIPEDAQAIINVRVRTKAQGEEVTALLDRNAQNTLIPDTRVTVTHDVSFPPLPNNPATDALAATADRVAAEIGLKLPHGGNGGASESALAYEGGIAALDGLGPIIWYAHSEREYIELPSLTPRLYVLTRLLMELGKSPPARLK
ncbi:glutamate carboxypeptidase [Sphingomonas sp. GlSt437]|uniref:glutamate carboxypeptidase n=1 Tax=Sphingomonas sp. GlSt437 TaxID=3389970 RepID=UPI003A8822CE